MLVILNDNSMSISPNVGAMSKYLTNILTDQSYNKLRNDIWRFIGKLKRAETIRATVSHFEAQLKGILIPALPIAPLAAVIVSTVVYLFILDLVKVGSIRAQEQGKGKGKKAS